MQPIGFADAETVLYRNLSVYLTQSSDYEEARFMVFSQHKTYECCSNQAEQTAAATCSWTWELGSIYASADFEAPEPEACVVPANIRFSDLSSNAGTYSWDFGDGNTSA